MFACLSTVVVAFTLFAGALAGPTKIEYEQCDGGIVRCCESIQDTKNLIQEHKGLIATLFEVGVKQVTGGLGLECSAVDVLAAGGSSSCTQQKVCCSNNNFNGALALGCNPINASA
ncbi:fungal hydrophobin-domain-containing protein [Coprinopsis sp. MPI-PUGE-AT-0042]|nr:fungal hydrophobin-domain-containing protein [Coprinopsis sp. MPI-PUGE-AT-0042]